MPAHSNKYLEVTLSNQQVADRLKYCIQTNTPFCLSRIGDGEIYIINNNVPEHLRKRISELWGFDVSEFHIMRDQYFQQLKDTINESDIVGILDKNNDICKKMKYNKELWSLPVSHLQKLDIKTPICCDHQLPRSKMFGDPNNFKDIISGAPINIVTPNSGINVEKLSDILETNVSVTLIGNDRQSLINKVQYIKETVVLYGVSITAKDLGILLKRRNKIAIDFGATLDAWAGIQTRPWFKDGNIQEHCVIK